MRAAAILGLGCSANNLKPFQASAGEFTKIEWRMGVPAGGDEADVILVFGGDGTIHRHLGQLVKLGLPVLVVPAGSGNDFARALGLLRVRDSLAAWWKFCAGGGNVRTIDLGSITPIALSSLDLDAAGAVRDSASCARYFAGVAGIGLDGEVTRRANRLPRWLRGQGGYVLSLVPALFSFATLPMKIMIPALPDPTENCHPDRSFAFPQGMGSAVEGPAVPLRGPRHPRTEPRPEVLWEVKKIQPTLLAAIANAPFYGGGMKIAPRARLDDGLLDICIVGDVRPFKLFCVFPTVYAGRHLRIREVDYFQSARVRIETERPLDVYADGEYVCRTPVEVSSQRAALRVIAP